MDSFIDEFAYLTPEQRDIIGMQVDKMVLSCRCGPKQCSHAFNITTSNTVENGNCFTFNGNGELGSVRPGSGNGLELELYLWRDELAFTPDNEKVCLFFSKN